MKAVILVVTLLFGLNSFGQTTNRNVVISFWESNVQAIIDLNKDQIIEQTNFPLEGSWGYTVELETAPEQWTKEDFIAHLDAIFNEATRKQLSEKTYNDLVHYNDESGNLVFIVNVNFLTKDDESGESFESSTIFFFKQFDNKWKLYSIEYAG